jgi:dTDP-4-amino-4,6-dideoxygalactose transaminase
LEEAILQIKREGKLTPRVIVAVDLFGQPADYPKLRQVADRYGLMILEDGAQGFGGRIGQQRACSFGDISFRRSLSDVMGTVARYLPIMMSG